MRLSDCPGNQRYFEGQQSLFADVAQGLKDLAVSVEKLVEIFNDGAADELESLIGLQGKTDPAGPGVPFSDPD